MSNEFIMNMKTRYMDDGPKILRVAHYHADDTPRLQIYSVDGTPQLIASVCVAPAKLEIEDAIIIKNWSENEGMYEALCRAQLIDPLAVAVYPTGFVNASAYKMQNELLHAWHSHKAE